MNSVGKILAAAVIGTDTKALSFAVLALSATMLGGCKQRRPPETGQLVGESLPDGTEVVNESDYKGFELTFQKRMSNNWALLTSYTYNNATAITGTGTEATTASSLFTNPNTLINSRGKPFWDRTNQFKLLGSYYAPYAIRISGVLRYQTGQPISRTFNVTGLNQGTFSILAVPVGDERLPNVTTADITIAKAFEPGFGILTLEGSFFNIANANTVTAINTNSGSAFGNVTNFLSPRIFRFGIKYMF